LAIASPDGPVAVGSKVGLAIASSVLASLLKAESRERRKETDEIRRATRLPRASPSVGGPGTYVLEGIAGPATMRKTLRRRRTHWRTAGSTSASPRPSRLGGQATVALLSEI
jgi:hypothetical protein